MFDEHEDGLGQEEEYDWQEMMDKEIALEERIVHIFFYLTLSVIIIGTAISIYRTLKGAS